MVLAVDKLTDIKNIVNFAQSQDFESEQIFIINKVSWNHYEDLLQFLGDSAGIKVQYWEENLAIMSPSHRHEFDKKIIGILLETYFMYKKIRFYPLGSTTFKNVNIQKGIEPDQCYCLHNNKEIPDLAIEVIVTSGGLDSLKIYQGLGVKEVWFWEKQKLKVYALQNETYTQVKKSLLLPELDLDLFAHYLSYDEPYDAVLEFKQKIEEKDLLGGA
jgi:Uma2 family endonuclease